ncbi:nucleolar preribosomal assembly protein,putative [Plasmodium sp. gorilla clade G2]|uniref:nucleolar preribosomal assembly protein,putative n=1 Tax=Plasmodium sp. gorilla clade G2 TaxID=880535 RepID=UPI000D218109|nr:nucleolar preribosomal assembly protein,putative [Plasmodium sp. gorilla clade G2]SOV15090.1 nucleolar preribosomal assembly protein,putative [Plasmodium sp. gorilla clade G2]
MDELNKEEIVDNIKNEKGKTRKGQLILKRREGVYEEGSKYCLFICSNKRSLILKNFMHDIYNIYKPLTCYMPKAHPNLSNIIDKIDKLVDICIHNNCSFFFSVFSTKKKPSRFIIGRLFNNKILDYYVFNLLSYIPLKLFSLSKEILYDTKPLVLIQGDYFEKNETNRYVKNILFDFFKHKNVESFSKKSIQRLIVISSYQKNDSNVILASDTKGEEDHNNNNNNNKNNYTYHNNNDNRIDDSFNYDDDATLEVTEDAMSTTKENLNDSSKSVENIYNNLNTNKFNTQHKYDDKDKKNIYVISFNQYLITKEFFNINKENEQRPKLQEIGPRFEFSLEENYKIPEYNLFQEALRNVKKQNKSKIKNTHVDEFGHNIKKVYIQKQNFNKLHTKHTKFVKKNKFNT